MVFSEISYGRRATGGVCWGVLGSYAATKVPAEMMPFIAMLAASGVLFAFWPMLRDANRWLREETPTSGYYFFSLLCILGFITGLGLLFVQIYRGYSDDKLRYSLCGEPIFHRDRLIGLKLGIQWSNPGYRAVTAFSENLTFDFGGVMAIPPERREFLIKTNAELAEEYKEAKQISVPFSEVILGIKDPKPVPPLIEGNLRYEWKFGRDRDNPKQRVIIAGVASMKFSDGGKRYSRLLFAPSGDSPHFTSVACNLREEFTNVGS